MQMNNDKVRSPDNELPLVIFHWSLVIFFLCALSGREKKCIAGFQPAKVVLTQKELSRLRCRRDAGATIFSHDRCLRGEKTHLIRTAPSRLITKPELRTESHAFQSAIRNRQSAIGNPQSEPA